MKPSIANKPDNTEREKYWNEDYVAYWKARVQEANSGEGKTSGLVHGDARTSSDDLYRNAIGLLQVSTGDSVLELACGFGRSLSALCQVAHDVAAVDISEQMIEEARAACSEPNVTFHVAPSEDLPFPNERFDAVVCFAAFDAMYQAEALVEISRICRPGARVLLTGKNDDYENDDLAAIEAEIGARSKHHPNYFTDIHGLMPRLASFGFQADLALYYRRRGDFGRGIGTDTMPEKFYEYMLLLRRTGDRTESGDGAISSPISKTFARRGVPAPARGSQP